MPFLADLVSSTRARVAEAKTKVTDDALEQRLASVAAPRDLLGALAGGGMRAIAEIKRATPSQGPLDLDLDASRLARAYAEGGAAAISVLTEPEYFKGSLEDLEAAKDAELPLLRKDFIIDDFQLLEARAAGADAVLLIAAVLPDGALQDLQALAAELRLETLVEVHDEEELERVLRTGARVIGINNRDLRTFVTEVAVTERLRPLIPEDRIVVSESGIHTREDATRVRALGVDAVLVGEALMTSGDVVGRMKELIV